jgi:hypothetical protein
MPDTELIKAIDIPPGELMEIIEAGKEVVERRKYFEYTPLGLIVHGNPPREVWGNALKDLLEAAESLPILIGDMINEGEKRYGETYTQYLPLRSYGTLRNIASYMRRVPIERRKPGLLYGHYCAVAKLDSLPELQEHYLAVAIKDNLNTNELDDLVCKEQGFPGRPKELLSCLGKVISTDKGWAVELWTSNNLSGIEEVSVTLMEVRRVN